MKDNSLISTVIVDDEEAAVDNLCFELRRHEGIRVEGIAGKGSAGIRLIEKKRPDLVFLDVDGNGCGQPSSQYSELGDADSVLYGV